MADKKQNKKIVNIPIRKHTSFSSLKEYNVLQPTPKLHFFIKLSYVIMKNFKLLIRSRTSALIFFFGPLFIMFVVSMGFNTSNLQGINVATYSESYSPLTESLIMNLSNDLNLEKKNSEQDCINSVRLATHHICLIFPSGMAVDNSANNNIQVYADESRTNLADTVIEKLASKVEIHSKEMSSGIITQMLGTLDSINKEVEVGKLGIAKVNENTNAGLTNVQDLLGSIDEFDFTNTIDITPLSDEIDDIKDSANISSSVFSNLEDLIEAIQLDVDAKLSAAKQKAIDVQEEGQSVKSSLQNTPAKIAEVENSLNSIRESISTLKVTNVANIVSPIKTTIKPLTANRSYLAYVLPSLLALLVMFVSLLLSATSMVREKESSAHFRNFITPTKDILFITGHFFSHISLLILQIAIMLGVTAIFIHGIPLTIYLLAGVLLVIFATFFIFLGMFLGNLFNSGESVSIAALSVATISLLFSNTVLPLEAVTGFLRTIVKYNPFVIVDSTLRQLLVFESISLSNQLYLLLGGIILSFILTLVANKLREKTFNNG
ncbi:MAG: ABC transporter permease [Nanoarchaeota archaeon]|nr:ABC transporter permease [Nanoarchaeota archaeon]